MKNFVISDHHLYHRNIIDYENRPFPTVEAMHKYIIKQHNWVVRKFDIVFFLGDISFSNKENTQKIVERLNGKKYLIKGNHDTRPDAWYLDCGFAWVSPFPIIYKNFVILSHEPIYLNKTMPFVNIHGHLHGQKYEGEQHINLSVEHWDYIPQDLDLMLKNINPEF